MSSHRTIFPPPRIPDTETFHDESFRKSFRTVIRRDDGRIAAVLLLVVELKPPATPKQIPVPNVKPRRKRKTKSRAKDITIPVQELRDELEKIAIEAARDIEGNLGTPQRTWEYFYPNVGVLFNHEDGHYPCLADDESCESPSFECLNAGIHLSQYRLKADRKFRKVLDVWTPLYPSQPWATREIDPLWRLLPVYWYRRPLQ